MHRNDSTQACPSRLSIIQGVSSNIFIQQKFIGSHATQMHRVCAGDQFVFTLRSAPQLCSSPIDRYANWEEV